MSTYASMLGELRADDRQRIAVERAMDGLAVVTLDDPGNHNALSGPLTLQLHAALSELASDPGVRVVVLTGAGPVFSVGGDWRLMEERGHTAHESEEGTTRTWRWIRDQFGGIARLIRSSETVFVAAVNGDVAGVALAWTLACDLIVAARSARFVLAFGRIGLVPEVGTSWVLARRLGHAKAFELYVSGRPLAAEEAASLGLVNEVTEDDGVRAAAVAWGERVLRLPDPVVRMTKTLFRSAADSTWEQTVTAEELAEPHTFTTRYHQEAIAALLAKRERALDPD